MGDVRVAVRSLLRQPLFALVAAGSLAVGIGANTAVFTAASALLLRDMPGIGEPDRVVEIGRSNRPGGFDTFSYPDFVDLRGQVQALDAVAAWRMEPVSIAGEDGGFRAQSLVVTPSYFTVLGVPEGEGRYLTPEEDRGIGAHPVAVLSHDFWQDRLGADPDVLGSTVMVNRTPYTVVGITPPGFRGHMTGIVPQLFVPMVQFPSLAGTDLMERRGASWHQVVGRLADGATVEGLNDELRALGVRLAQAYPETNENRSFRAVELGPVPAPARPAVRVFFGALLGMVGLVLLVTCANVAGMFVARSLTREREVAVRRALGAGRRRIVQLLTVEALVVFLLGGGLGTWLGIEAVGLLGAVRLPLPELIHLDLAPDYRVLVFSLFLTLGSGLLFGLLPAAQATRLDLVASLKGESAAGRVGSLRKLFAASQVGLSLVIVVTAGLFLRSVQRVGDVDTGFDATGVYTTSLDLSREGYEGEVARVFQEELRDRLASLSWVESAALSLDLPMDLASHGTGVIPEGWSDDGPRPGLSVDINRVSPGYFETLRIGTLAGRVIDGTDGPESEPVVVVSRAFAARVFPGEEAVGRTLRTAGQEDGPLYRIVGVVEDTPNQMITDDPGPFVYFALAQEFTGETVVSVRTDRPATEALGAVRSAVLGADPGISLGPVLELERYTSVALLPQRLAAALSSGLALIALLLSALGIYGVVAYAVGSQRREIGIRMALGASSREVVAGYLRSGLRMALPGLVVGVALSLVLSRVLQSLLMGLSAWDPIALTSASAVLTAVILLAAWMPARRAAVVDPAVSLRSE